MNYNKQKKLDNEKAKFRVYCKCGHSLNIYPFEHIIKKECTHCHKMVYVNELEEFKDKVRKEMKK